MDLGRGAEAAMSDRRAVLVTALIGVVFAFGFIAASLVFPGAWHSP
jgi:hypothetical protein